VKSPSENQLRAIIDTMAKSNPQFGVAVVSAALTGARRAESLGLRWADIEHEHISIRGSLTYTKAEEVKYGPTKTHHARRVMLDDLGTAVIQSQKNHLVDVCAALDLTPVENPWLFCSEVDGSKPSRTPTTLALPFGEQRRSSASRIAKQGRSWGVLYWTACHDAKTSMAAHHRPSGSVTTAGS